MVSTILNKCSGIAACAVLLTAAAGAQQVSTDYNHEQDFSHYHTFSIHKVQSTDPFYQQRISDDITRDLQSKGLEMVSSGGDLAVTAIGAVKTQQEYNTFYDGLGGAGFGWGGRRGWGGGGFGGAGESSTTVQNVPIGTLMVDLYDTNTHQLVWRGTSQEEVSSKSEKNTGKVNKSIDKMFDKYPPKGAK